MSHGWCWWVQELAQSQRRRSRRLQRRESVRCLRSGPTLEAGNPMWKLVCVCAVFFWRRCVFCPCWIEFMVPEKCQDLIGPQWGMRVLLRMNPCECQNVGMHAHLLLFYRSKTVSTMCATMQVLVPQPRCWKVYCIERNMKTCKETYFYTLGKKKVKLTTSIMNSQMHLYLL